MNPSYFHCHVLELRMLITFVQAAIHHAGPGDSQCGTQPHYFAGLLTADCASINMWLIMHAGPGGSSGLDNVQVVGMSATLPNVDEVGSTWLQANTP